MHEWYGDQDDCGAGNEGGPEGTMGLDKRRQKERKDYAKANRQADDGAYPLPCAENNYDDGNDYRPQD